MADAVALGELLIDFTPAGKSESGEVPLFEQNPGGAPANVLALLSKWNKQTAFIGKVGKDQFGRYLEKVLQDSGIDTAGLIFTGETNTTLAFVHLQEDGDRSFSFYRKPGADMMLQAEEIRRDLVEGASIFHFGSISMTDEPVKSATLAALKLARDKGVLVSYDPNLREPLWRSLDEAKKGILCGLKYADILKISEEELRFISDLNDLELGTRWLREQFGISFILVTLGAEGCYYRIGEFTGWQPGFRVRTVDTTGAGDAFLGAILYQVLDRLDLNDQKDLDSRVDDLDDRIKGMERMKELTLPEIDEMVRYANAVGALTTMKKGAIPALPGKEEVTRFLQQSL